MNADECRWLAACSSSLVARRLPLPRITLSLYHPTTPLPLLAACSLQLAASASGSALAARALRLAACSLQLAACSLKLAACGLQLEASCFPLSTLRPGRCRPRRMARGRCGSPGLHRTALPSATACRLPGASLTPFYRCMTPFYHQGEAARLPPAYRPQRTGWSPPPRTRPGPVASCAVP